MIEDRKHLPLVWVANKPAIGWVDSEKIVRSFFDPEMLDWLAMNKPYRLEAAYAIEECFPYTAYVIPTIVLFDEATSMAFDLRYGDVSS